MKLIIAGGRDYYLSEDDFVFLTCLEGITEVVSGCARGADTCGELWAKHMGIPVTRFPAEWDKYGNRAGPIRNRKMAEYADALAVFPGGSGTRNMIAVAEELGLEIYYGY